MLCMVRIVVHLPRPGTFLEHFVFVFIFYVFALLCYVGELARYDISIVPLALYFDVPVLLTSVTS